MGDPSSPLQESQTKEPESRKEKVEVEERSPAPVSDSAAQPSSRRGHGRRGPRALPKPSASPQGSPRVSPRPSPQASPKASPRGSPRPKPSPPPLPLRAEAPAFVPGPRIIECGIGRLDQPNSFHHRTGQRRTSLRTPP
eukprot:NODE_6177_length_526_cov_8.664570_g5414_i0.p3 GENE.NODE_6177_length_526_cov_8.664570_g5414_i0~~NODE_6177_length_526_cov_8.664570_g5414_i0.p3  ORF type:complete len:139 (+),score=17.02 NODE_6177_length_526_cov_8.664570_g5414_i0:33-449(+)